jgi:uncharacterized protein (DUF697 family)
MPRSKKTTILSNPLNVIPKKKSSTSKANIENPSSNLIIEDVEFKEIDSVPIEMPKDARHQIALKTVSKWANWSTASGLIPIPLADLALVSGIQIKLIASLCKIYGVPFRKEAAKAILNSVIGSGAIAFSSKYVAKLLVKNIPVVGFAVHMVTQQAISYAATYAIGLIFIRHFEQNGSLSDLNIVQAKEYFDKEIRAIKTKT